MSGEAKKCRYCHGRGYVPCECWPGDCICGFGDEDCEFCDGEGTIYPEDEWEDWADDFDTTPDPG